MEYVEVVVKVPEGLYNKFGHEYREENLISKYTNDAILEAFCNGILLPKGHGDLVDYKELKNNAGEYGAYAEATLSHIKPKTLIEADTGSEDKEWQYR